MVTRFPVRAETTFGLHWLALICSDVQNQEYLRATFREYRSWGATSIKLITSPGGDGGWAGKPLGCSEQAFIIALEEGLQPHLRIFGSTHPPFITPEREVMMNRFKTIALSVIDRYPERFQEYDYLFAVEPANEVDVASDESGGVRPTPEQVAIAFIPFAEKTERMGIKPLFPSVGYGGPKDYLSIFRTLGALDIFEYSGIAAHPYAGPFPIEPMWPFHPILLEGTPVTQEEWDSYNPWCWDIGTANPRTREYVNMRREQDAEYRSMLSTQEELYSAYNYGWFTVDWAIWLAQKAGIRDPELYLTECGTRRGEMFDTLPRVDPNLHMQYTRDMIVSADANPHVAVTHH